MACFPLCTALGEAVLLSQKYHSLHTSMGTISLRYSSDLLQIFPSGERRHPHLMMADAHVSPAPNPAIATCDIKHDLLMDLLCHAFATCEQGASAEASRWRKHN